jgi:PEGA domain-containing protein
MRRGALAGVVLVASWVGLAGAEPTRKVDIDSDPPGATVYLGDIDQGEACKPTPCSVEAPVGKKTPVILRKDGFSPEIGVIDMRKGRVKALKFTLTSAEGTLVLDDPALAGGTITVDDVDKGKAPAHVQVETAGHHVVVTVKGHDLYDGFITINAGDEYTIKPNKAPPAPMPPKLVADPKVVAAVSGDDDARGSSEDTSKIGKHVDVSSRDSSIAVSGVFQVGFRQFAYDNPKNLAPTEVEGGQVLVGPALELWPTRLLGIDHLHGLSLYGKVEFGANHREVLQDPDAMPTGALTFWGNIEIDLKQRWNIGDSAAIELGGGFVRDQLQYTGPSQMVLNQVPYADYRSLRLGVRGILRFGPIEPYAQIEGRIVLSAGDLATRFGGADVTGGAAVGGIAATFGPIIARLEGSIVYYGWSITNANATGSDPTADGASDVIEGVALWLGFAY